MKKFIFLLFLSACQQADKATVSPEKMALILKDMHIAQTYVYEQKLSNQERQNKLKQLYFSILSKYNVSKQDFHEAMNYYSDHVHELDSIYKMIIEKTSNPNQN